MHLAAGGNAQAVAFCAEGFFVGGDDADASGVVGVVVFARGAGKRATLALLPAIGKQPRGDVRGADVRALVERGVVAGLHEFDVAHGEGAGFEVGEGVFVEFGGAVAHQQGVEFEVVVAAREQGVDGGKQRGQVVFASEALEGGGAEAVHGEVDLVDACVEQRRVVLCEAVAVGGERDFLDAGGAGADADDVGDVGAQGGFAAGETDFFGAAGGKGGDKGADFGKAEFVRAAAALVAVRQAVDAAVVAEVGNGEAQVGDAAREGVYQHQSPPRWLARNGQTVTVAPAGWSPLSAGRSMRQLARARP